MRSREVKALMFAVMLAAGSHAAMRVVGWTPICATFEEGSMLWVLFGCDVNTPPKDPRV